MVKKCEIFDTTLRDGAQAEGISFSVQDKLDIIKALDNFGVSYIEAGNPGSNPKEAKLFEEIKKIKLKNSKICAFGSTRRKDKEINSDRQITDLLNAGTDTVAIVGKTWDLQVKNVLKESKKENLAMIFESIKFFKDKNKEVIFDAEHFFDGYKSNPEYAKKTLEYAKNAGADVICLCDTNGGTYLTDIYEITKKIAETFENTRIGIHCHNDMGTAVANSLLAVEAGAVMVQGTFIGFGERTGNANLSSIIPDLQLKRNVMCIENGLYRLTDTALKIAEICNISVNNSSPYIGSSAFAHKGGMHVDGESKNKGAFQQVDPLEVGNTRKFLLSEFSGKSAVFEKIKDIDQGILKSSEKVEEILKKLKEMELLGYQFEAAEASFNLLVKKILNKFKQHFTLDMYKITGDYPAVSKDITSTAAIQISLGDKEETAKAAGNGPVHALDNALRKALLVFYPELKKTHLTDYKVRVLDTDKATGAKVRVLIESSDGVNVWTTIGVATDIIEASFLALQDSFEYILNK